MNIDVYTNVEGGVKGLLETQELLFSLLNVENKTPSELLGLPFVQDTHKWWERCVEEMQHKFEDSVNSLDADQVKYCSILQLNLPHGLLINKLVTYQDSQKVMIFWSKNLGFFLRIKSLPKLEQPPGKELMHPLEELIKRNPERVSEVLQHFYEHQKSPEAKETQFKTQDNILIKFLNFYQSERPESNHGFFRICRDGLYRSHKVKNNSVSSCKRSRLDCNVLEQLALFRSEVSRRMGNSATV